MNGSEASNLRRASTWRVLGFVAGLLAVRLWTLDEPVSWDAVWTTVPGAVFLAENGFDVPALSAWGQQWYGTEWVRAWSPVTWLDAAVVALLPTGMAPVPWLRMVHIVLGGLALDQVWRLARRTGSAGFAAGVTAVTVTLPVFLAQTSFIYFEIPMTLAILLAANAALSNRVGRTVLFSAVAAAIKATGAFAAFAIAAHLVIRKRTWRSVGEAFLIVSPATALALRDIGGIEAYSEQPIQEPLARIRASFDVLVASDLAWSALLVVAGLGSVFLTIRRTQTPSSVSLGRWMVAGFLGVFLVAPLVGQPQLLLPRYVVAIVPFVVLIAADFLASTYSRRAAMVAALAMVLFSVANTTGRFNPAPAVPNIVIQERSDRHLELLALQNEALFAAIDTGLPVYVDLNRYMRSQLPELGVVSEPQPSVKQVPSDLDIDALPDAFVIPLTDQFAFAHGRMADELRSTGDYEVTTERIDRDGFVAEILTFRR